LESNRKAMKWGGGFVELRGLVESRMGDLVLRPPDRAAGFHSYR